jgi:ribonuclease T1
VRLVAALAMVCLASSVFAFLKDVRVADLPLEARATIELIYQNGPFAHAQDGKTFGNREKLLPQRARGYYREYTVPTPGEAGRARSARDRGARRVVTGNGGELYYTDDHYRSFRRIRE